mgnify:CR=1 FL=1
MPQQYDLNEIAVLRLEYMDAVGAVDPATIVMTVTRPDGTTFTVNKAGMTSNPVLGTFTYNLSLTQVGIWRYEAVSTNPNVTQGELLVVGASLGVGLCDNWILPSEVFGCAPCSSIVTANQDELIAARAATATSEMLFVLTGRQFPGLCDVTIRPCRSSSCWSVPRTTGYWPVGECTCGASSWDACGCGGLSQIRLPGRVRGVIEVRVDGAVIPAADYRVDDWKWLVRLDDLSWPSCQDLSADPLTEVDTFQVRYVRGTPPPESGVLAAQRYACELYRGLTGEECRIPQKVTNIVRQGVSMQFIKPAEIGVTANGEVKTGIAEVDMFLATFGRGGRRRRRGSIASPDVGPLARRVGT